MKAVQVAILILGTLCIVIGANYVTAKAPAWDIQACLEAEVDKIIFGIPCGLKPACLKLSIMKPYIQFLLATKECTGIRSIEPLEKTEKMIVGTPVNQDPLVGDDKRKKAPQSSRNTTPSTNSEDHVAH